MSRCPHCRRTLLEGPLAALGLVIGVLVLAALFSYVLGSLLAWLVMP